MKIEELKELVSHAALIQRAGYGVHAIYSTHDLEVLTKILPALIAAVEAAARGLGNTKDVVKVYIQSVRGEG